MGLRTIDMILEDDIIVYGNQKSDMILSISIENDIINVWFRISMDHDILTHNIIDQSTKKYLEVFYYEKVTSFLFLKAPDMTLRQMKVQVNQLAEQIDNGEIDL